MEGFSLAPAVDVPSYFLCPISMEIMRDPVTLSSGITYDRDSIERWVFTDGHGECPMTKQRLGLGAGDREPTPNHTLRRLIQGWCAVHAVERFPTPRAPVDAARVASVVDAARRGGAQELVASLGELADIVAESDCNRRCVEGAPGAVAFLVSVVKTHATRDADDDAAAEKPLLPGSSRDEAPNKASSPDPEEVALGILHSLKLSPESWKRILERGDNFLDTMAAVLTRRPAETRPSRSHLSRTYGIQLLKAAVSEMPPAQLTSASADLVDGVVSLLTADKQQPPPSSGKIQNKKAVKIALQVLCRLCLWGRNRVKAVEAGAVSALVDLLLDECCGSGSKRVCELAVVVMDHLCGCAEGRLELVAHPAGLAMMARAVSVRGLAGATTESAVRALHAVARHSATPAVLQEMLAVGVVGRLLFLLQAGAAGDKPRERAREMLKMHARVWKGSPCFAPHLHASYPC